MSPTPSPLLGFALCLLWLSWKLRHQGTRGPMMSLRTGAHNPSHHPCLIISSAVCRQTPLSSCFISLDTRILQPDTFCSSLSVPYLRLNLPPEGWRRKEYLTYLWGNKSAGRFLSNSRVHLMLKMIINILWGSFLREK